MRLKMSVLAVSLLGLSMAAFAQDKAQQVQTVKEQNDKQAQQSIDVSPEATYDPWVGNVTSTYAFVGSSYFQEKTIDIVGFYFGTTLPAAISCQPRQSANYDYGFHDAFSCQIISTSNNAIRVRVRRLDSATGWGQNLRLDFIVFSKIN